MTPHHELGRQRNRMTEDGGNACPNSTQPVHEQHTRHAAMYGWKTEARTKIKGVSLMETITSLWHATTPARPGALSGDTDKVNFTNVGVATTDIHGRGVPYRLLMQQALTLLLPEKSISDKLKLRKHNSTQSSFNSHTYNYYLEADHQRLTSVSRRYQRSTRSHRYRCSTCFKFHSVNFTFHVLTDVLINAPNIAQSISHHPETAENKQRNR